MRNEVSAELIRKYINKECTPEESRLVEDWYASFDNEPEPLRDLTESSRQELKDNMFGNITDAIQGDEHPVRSISKTKVRIMYHSLLGIAASILLILGISWYQGRTFSFDAGNKEIVLQNTSKSIKRQRLSDGSVVWLQPQTSITYPEQFGGDLREVYLTGEAFFEVTKNPARPFIVYSRDVITKVLGTSFNIKAFENMKAVEVSVVTGKVTVRLADHSSDRKTLKSENRQVVLLPEQKAVFNENSHTLKKEVIEKEMPSDVKIWKKTDVTFDNVPLQVVAQKLEKEYGIKISIESESLKDYLLKADFSGQNLPDILEMLEKSLNVSYEINEQNIIIKSNSH